MEKKRGMDLNVTVAKGGKEVDKPATEVETFQQLSTSLAKASFRKDQLSTYRGR
jgi:beta-lactam-binding protein with PASTA domain